VPFSFISWRTLFVLLARSKQHFVLYWLVVGLGCGALTQQFLSRYVPALPYTAALLVEGVIIGVAAEFNPPQIPQAN
jgi:hypothetical protein